MVKVIKEYSVRFRSPIYVRMIIADDCAAKHSHGFEHWRLFARSIINSLKCSITHFFKTTFRTGNSNASFDVARDVCIIIYFSQYHRFNISINIRFIKRNIFHPYKFSLFERLCRAVSRVCVSSGLSPRTTQYKTVLRHFNEIKLLLRENDDFRDKCNRTFQRYS